MSISIAKRQEINKELDDIRYILQYTIKGQLLLPIGY